NCGAKRGRYGTEGDVLAGWAVAQREAAANGRRIDRQRLQLVARTFHKRGQRGGRREVAVRNEAGGVDGEGGVRNVGACQGADEGDVILRGRVGGDASIVGPE